MTASAAEAIEAALFMGGIESIGSFVVALREKGYEVVSVEGLRVSVMALEKIARYAGEPASVELANEALAALTASEEFDV